MNQKQHEERMQDQHYKELVVTKCTSQDDYVFISYRGNSWRTVLSNIVYKLQTEYGLRIYFDKEFASDTNIWINQFQENMDAKQCKGFLCFLDEGYVTSYATLLELMHAMNKRSKLSDKIVPINFPIEWEKLDDDKDTGLGKEDPGNPGYREEKETFIAEFDLLKEKEGYSSIKEYYRKGRPLRVCDCKDIMAVIQPKNQHPFSDTEEFYVQHVLKPLFNITGGSVFEDPEKIKKLINGDNTTKDEGSEVLPQEEKSSISSTKKTKKTEPVPLPQESSDDLKIGKLVRNVLKPLIIEKATPDEVQQMQDKEYSKKTFGIQYPLLLKTSQQGTVLHYYKDPISIRGEQYLLCDEWYKKSISKVEEWIKKHQ